MVNKFKYNKTLDTKITEAVAAVLSVNLLKAVRIKQGEINHVYKVVTENKNYLLRVFQYPTWPENGKLEWIEQQLQKNKIIHAKILYFSRSTRFFPYGFMVSEYIEGQDGRKAVENKTISLKKAYFEIGKALKNVHKIKFSYYGKINKGKGKYTSFTNWKINDEIPYSLKKLRKTRTISEKFEKEILATVKGCFLPYENRFKAVLNHGDPSRENAIWSKNKQWVLVDWDNAVFSTWVEDYADLTFWANFKKNDNYNTRKLNIFKKNFFIAYGKPDFKLSEINIIERGLHIIRCLKLMDYYYFNKQSRFEFKLTKAKLLKLLHRV